MVVRKRVHAELILVDTTERALDAIGNRMPDLVLVPALLSPQDDAAIAAALRVIAAAAHVQLLTARHGATNRTRSKVCSNTHSTRDPSNFAGCACPTFCSQGITLRWLPGGIRRRLNARASDARICLRPSTSPSSTALADPGAIPAFKGTDRAWATDAQHQALHDAEPVIQVVGLHVGRRQVEPHGNIQVLAAAVDQQGPWLRQHCRWIHTATRQLFDLLQLEHPAVVEDAVQVGIQAWTDG